MQLYLIDWSFQNAEDQLFATNEFCNYLKEGKIYQAIDGFELKYIAHTPQNGTGVIICEAQNMSLLFKIFKIWRENFCVSFNFRPALTNEQLLSSHDENSFWKKN